MPIKRPFTPDELNEMEAAGYNTSNYKGELIEFPDKPKESTAAGAGFRAALAGLIPSTATVAAGAAGAKGGAALGALTGNPIGIAAGGLIGMIGGGMAGGMAATKLQEAALPEAAVKRLALDAQEQPWAVRGGQLASLLPTIAVSPTTLVRAAGAIPQLGASAAGRTVANRVGMDALKNVGLGVGINTALEGGRQALAGDFNVGALAAEAVVGAAFNRQTKLGHWAMRTKQTGERVVDNPDALMATIAKVQPTPEEVAKLKEINEAKKNEVNALKEIQKAQKLKEQEEATKRKMAGLEPLKVKKPGEPIKSPEATKPTPPSEPPHAAEPPAAPTPTPPVTPAIAPTATPPVAPKPVAPVMAKPKATPTPKATPAPTAPKVETPVVVEKPVEVIVKPAIDEPKTKAAPKQSKADFYAAKRKEHEKAVTELEEAWQAVADGDDPAALQKVVGSYGGKGEDIHQFEMSLKPGTDEFIAAVIKLRGDKSKPGKAKAEKVVAKKPIEEDTTDTMPLQDGPVVKSAETPAGEKPTWVTTLESIKPENRNQSQQERLDAYNKSIKNQEATTVQTPLGKEVSDALAAKKKSTSPTTAYKKAVGEIDRGLPPVQENPDLTAKGSFNTKTGERIVNPKTETLDTRPHETAHDLVRTIYDAKSKGSTRATDYITKLERTQQEGLDAYNKERKAKGLEAIDHEEFAVSQQGHEFLKQQLNLKKETSWRKWVNDTKALFNTTYGKNPTIDELRRVLNFRMVNENVAPRTFEKAAPVAPKVTGFKNAEERDAAIRGIKTPEEAKTVIERLKAEREVLAKEGLAATMDSDARHSVASKMMANKLDIQSIAEKHKVESGEIKYQDKDEGLPLTDRDSDILPPDPTSKSFIRQMSATFDRVDEVSPTIGQAARDYDNRKSGYVGLGNTALVDLSKYKATDVDRVMAAHREAYRTGEDPTLDGPNDTAISEILSNYYGKIADIRNEIGLKINNRTGGKNQYYVPDMMNAKTIDVFINRPLSEEARWLKQEWAEHILNQEGTEYLTVEDVITDINQYIEAMGGKNNNYKSIEFGAVRKAAGYGLPESMRDSNAINTLARYSRRAAADLAFFQEIQSKPEIAGPLHIKDLDGNVPKKDANSALPQDQKIRDMMKWVTNDIGGVQNNSPKLRSVVRMVNNALLGPATGIRDLMSVPVNALPYINKFSDLGAAWKGIADTRINSRMALETGARQPSIDKVAFDDILQAPDRFSVIVGKVADGLRKYQGREFMENLARDITFSVGKELGRNNIIGARAGHNQSKLWLKKFGDLVEGDVLALEGEALDTALNQIGKNFTDRNQGTYGGRGLPIGIVDSQFAPFFSLQRWSVEKANVIYKDVYRPFVIGENRLPLLTYTLGSILTGAAIQQVNQLMTSKKGIDPTIKEALDKGDPAAIAQEIAVIMQLASHAGIMSDMVKIATDTTIRGRVPRNIVSFPTATAAIRTTEAITDMAEALRQGENPWDVWKGFTFDLLTTNIQGLRMLANHTVNDEETDRKDKFRDRRVYNELEGKPAGVIAKTNPYLGLNAKKFKKTADIKEAVEMAPALVKRAAVKSGGSIEEFRRSLASLKGNSYQTMPSPKDSPEEFKKFYDFLVRTQGIDAANERVKDYVMQTQVNKAKSKLIP